MLFETEGEELRTVATDGHRLAVCSMPIGVSLPNHSVIVPRKGVIELMRMLDGGETPLRVQIGSNNIRAHWITTAVAVLAIRRPFRCHVVCVNCRCALIA
jgi:DNA polymerase III sliding clamp (beta) subunit (PCNA family)